jgi:oxygen-independent coproporphyrinogen-3 oxidase
LDAGCEGFESAVKSIELDPRTTSTEQVELLAHRGFTRASLGVQDFNPRVQELVHRVQPFEMVRDVLRMLRTEGFDSVNFDLIYGLPGQTERTVAETVERVIELSPDRIALYGYAHVQWKAKAQRALDKYSLPNARQRMRLFVMAERLLTDAGYIPIGLDHFALPSDELVKHAEAGTLHRNFMGYTTAHGRGVLGLGISSISDVHGVLYQNFTGLEEYSRAVREGRLPIYKIKERSEDDVVRAYLIERIMCDGELRFSRLPAHIADAAARVIDEASANLAQMERDGLIIWDTESIRATFPGRYFLRSFASAFNSYLGTHAGEPFSKAI